MTSAVKSSPLTKTANVKPLSKPLPTSKIVLFCPAAKRIPN
jgi:hypothetical protein